MDDPWANAWGDTTADRKPTNSWSSSSRSTDVDQEADIALPSWSTGAAIQWSEPSETHASLWAPPSSDTLKPWDPPVSPYENILISQPTLSETELSASSPEPQSADVESQTSQSRSVSPVSPSVPLPSEPAKSVFPTPPSPNIHLPTISPPDSPDAFGTFETALQHDIVEDVEVDPWSPTHASFAPPSADSNAWGAAWGPPEAEEIDDTDEPVDEWEAAKQQKQQQDRYVPPELLAAILRQFEDLSHDLWSDAETLDPSVKLSLRSIEDFEDIIPSRNRLVPSDLILQPLTPFPKTFISKSMTEAIKLTRHAPFTRISPMSQYLASKGSTAWEASVKSRPELVQDDFLPPGWRVVPKEQEELPGPDAKRKSSGGLLSFFGRRPATPPIVDGRTRSMSPAQHVKSVTSTPRASLDMHKSTPDVASQSSSSSTSVVSPPIPVSVALPSTPTGSTFPVLPELQREPTAVSRFLNRFSRAKSASSNPRNIALSPDDLEFLSDIVPSASDSVEGDDQLQALSDMIEATPLPTKLPPPLAAPPRFARGQSLNGTTSKDTEDFASLYDAPVLRSTPPPVQKLAATPPLARGQSLNNTTSKVIDDFASLFDAPVLQPTPPPVPKSTATPPFLLPSAAPVPNVPPILPVSLDLRSFPSRGNTPPSNAATPRSTSSTNSFILPPPKRNFVPIMSSSSSTAAPALPPKLEPFNLPPPPSLSRSQSPMFSDMRKTASPPPVSEPPASLFDEEEFTDFHSHPATSSTKGPLSSASSAFYDASFTSLSSEQSLFSGLSSTSNPPESLEFDDFVFSPLRTPSPPRPPAKPSPAPRIDPAPVPKSPPLPAPSPQSQPSVQGRRRTSRAAEHQRTLSLVEIAASRPGRWPAPPSPIPPALPLPGGSIAADLDIFKRGTSGGDAGTKMTSNNFNSSMSSPALFDSSPQTSNVLLNPLHPSLNPTTLFSAPMSSSRHESGILSAALPSPSPFTGVSVSPAPSSTKSGGLSAQDLSFFEGL